MARLDVGQIVIEGRKLRPVDAGRGLDPGERVRGPLLLLDDVSGDPSSVGELARGQAAHRLTKGLVVVEEGDVDDHSLVIDHQQAQHVIADANFFHAGAQALEVGLRDQCQVLRRRIEVHRDRRGAPDVPAESGGVRAPLRRDVFGIARSDLQPFVSVGAPIRGMPARDDARIVASARRSTTLRDPSAPGVALFSRGRRQPRQPSIALTRSCQISLSIVGTRCSPASDIWRTRRGPQRVDGAQPIAADSPFGLHERCIAPQLQFPRSSPR